MRQSDKAIPLGILAVLMVLSTHLSGWTASPAPQARQQAGQIASTKKPPAATSKDAGKPFVIRETYRENSQAANNPLDNKGIVGLDMLVEPDRYPVVQRVFRGTPAQTQGLRIGDTILAINGVRTLHQSLWELDAMISDVPGDVVTLTILRDGKLRKFGLTVMPLSEANASVKSTFSGFGP
ncbi:PDZ domain-containing protein [Vampirovibrio chlorellavorus]|uniref:PDZ domain-containing protein n=1 Tax=Vampirovibrio chlorellavorus TaxID=758823 RepID=UPI0026EB836B|nr:PDZ domain-containing protein [Vampirovibrio chlorellavorus]